MLRDFVWYYMPEFAKALEAQLVIDEKRWGDTWKKRTRHGHEERIENDIMDYFDHFRNGGVPVPWLKIAGLALIAWIRELEGVE